MPRLAVVGALMIGLVVGIASTWWFTQQRRADTPAAAPATASSEAKVLYWYDPMVPNQHFDKPGKSPFMDMQLVPKMAGGASDSAGVVSIDARLVQNLGVRTARATRGTLQTTLRATGTVAFDDSAVTWVQARVAGIVDQLAVRTPLSDVVQGQALLTLIAPDWTAAQAEYLSLLQSRSAGLDTLRSAARQRLLLLGLNESQVRRIERDRRAQDRITITAPRGGVIGELMVRDGASVAVGTPLLRINGLDTVWINAAIPEIQAARVSRGLSVDIELPAFPGETLTGIVEALLSDLDAATRTQTARVVVRNPGHRLVPGMFATVNIAAAAGAPTVVIIPSEAVIATGTRNVVIVDVGDGRFRAQQVRVGEESNGQTVVQAGIDEGERVVLSGQFLIDSEANLTGTLARLSGGDASHEAAIQSPQRHEATGTLQGIEGNKWTIATDAIAALDMDAMTMRFIMPEGLPATGIKPGERIHIIFHRDKDGDFEIDEFTRQTPSVPAEPRR